MDVTCWNSSVVLLNLNLELICVKSSVTSLSNNGGVIHFVDLYLHWWIAENCLPICSVDLSLVKYVWYVQPRNEMTRVFRFFYRVILLHIHIRFCTISRDLVDVQESMNLVVVSIHVTFLLLERKLSMYRWLFSVDVLHRDSFPMCPMSWNWRLMFDWVSIHRSLKYNWNVRLNSSIDWLNWSKERNFVMMNVFVMSNLRHEDLTPNKDLC